MKKTARKKPLNYKTEQYIKDVRKVDSPETKDVELHEDKGEKERNEKAQEANKKSQQNGG